MTIPERLTAAAERIRKAEKDLTAMLDGMRKELASAEQDKRAGDVRVLRVAVSAVQGATVALSCLATQVGAK